MCMCIITMFVCMYGEIMVCICVSRCVCASTLCVCVCVYGEMIVCIWVSE